MKQFLTLAQNTCAASVFLNLFGLILEERDTIDEFTELHIYDSSMTEIGNLRFNGGKVLMNATYPLGKLQASFPLAEATLFADHEGAKPGEFKAIPALHGSWRSDIQYQYTKPDGITFNGSAILESSIDTEFGLNCLCHFLLKCDHPELGKVTLKILRDGSFLRLDMLKGEAYENINFSPFGRHGQILHDIFSGKSGTVMPYRYNAGVFDMSESKNLEDKFQVFLLEKEYERVLNHRNEFIDKIANARPSQLIIQQGYLMQQLDPRTYARLDDLRKLLTMGNISLLDNLISVCFDSYTDEEIKALLNCERHKPYQNGLDNLIAAYFGLGKSSVFLPIEKHPQLLPTKK